MNEHTALVFIAAFAFLALTVVVSLGSRKPRHQHGPWEVRSVNFVPSTMTSMETGPTGPGAHELTERLMYGVSTITQRCTGCGLAESYTVTGDAR